jgi:hypothetical protein
MVSSGRCEVKSHGGVGSVGTTYEAEPVMLSAGASASLRLAMAVRLHDHQNETLSGCICRWGLFPGRLDGDAGVRGWRNGEESTE